jgi:hypothetical protein
VAWRPLRDEVKADRVSSETTSYTRLFQVLQHVCGIPSLTGLRESAGKRPSVCGVQYRLAPRVRSPSLEHAFAPGWPACEDVPPPSPGGRAGPRECGKTGPSQGVIRG